MGIYAISVSGRLPPGIVRELKSRGVVYRSRDNSTNVWAFYCIQLLQHPDFPLSHIDIAHDMYISHFFL